MSSQPRVDSAGKLDLGQVQNLKRKPAKVQNLNPQPEIAQKARQMTPHEQASVLFDMACLKFGQKNEALAIEISQATGSTVSESIVSRWRKVDQRDVPNEAQLLALGSEFNRIYYRLKRDHFGWARLALIDLVNAVGDVALNQE